MRLYPGHRTEISSTKREGAITLEFVIAFPVLIITFLAVLQFAILALVQQAVTAAAIEGAREGARVASTHNSIATVVQSFLATHSLTFTTTGTNVGDDARVFIEHPTLGNADRGDDTIVCTANGAALAADQVRVTVCLHVSDPLTGKKPVPDLLSSFGMTLTTYRFEISAIADLEE